MVSSYWWWWWWWAISPLLTEFQSYRNDPKFSDRYAWANSADPDQTAPLIRVYTVCHSVCIVWPHDSMVEPHSSNFRVITMNILGVWKFRKFTVIVQWQGDYGRFSEIGNTLCYKDFHSAKDLNTGCWLRRGNVMFPNCRHLYLFSACMWQLKIHLNGLALAFTTKRENDRGL